MLLHSQWCYQLYVHSTTQICNCFNELSAGGSQSQICSNGMASSFVHSGCTGSHNSPHIHTPLPRIKRTVLFLIQIPTKTCSHSQIKQVKAEPQSKQAGHSCCNPQKWMSQWEKNGTTASSTRTHFINQACQSQFMMSKESMASF